MKTGVSNDPLGQIHIRKSSDRYYHLKIVWFLRDYEKVGTDGQTYRSTTYMKIRITTGHDYGLGLVDQYYLTWSWFDSVSEADEWCPESGLGWGCVEELHWDSDVLDNDVFNINEDRPGKVGKQLNYIAYIN